MTGPVSLTLAGVSKSFGPVQALKPLDLDIRPGELMALLGPSGCGKTTTLRIVAGFELPDTGTVFIGDRDMTELPPNKRGLGMVFQNYSLFPHMTVGENVAFGLKMHGVSAPERAHRVREMLGIVRLDGFEARHAHQLSGGQQQRVALARSLVTRPSVLLLDEPLGALDKNLREGMQFELRELQRRLGITTVLVTHDQEEALTMSDRIAVMNAGEVVQVDSPTEVYERPRTRFVSEFLGTANVLTGTVEGRASDGAWALRFDLEGSPRGPVAVGGEPPVGRKVAIAIRPERIAIVTPGQGVLQGRIHDRVFRGSYYAYEVVVPGRPEPIFAYQQADQDRAGEAARDGAVGIAWRAENAVLLLDEAA
jgi:putative spermidine/putrescine transport system ATP-binding protein